MLDAFTRAPDGVRTSQARLTSNDVSRRREVLGGFAPPPFVNDQLTCRRAYRLPV